MAEAATPPTTPRTFPSLQRAAADACLREAFGDQYGQLLMGQDSLLITDLLMMAADEGWPDLYAAARELAARVHPATLASYVDTLGGGRDG